MNEIKTWEIYHYIYTDVCGDSWYGKVGRHTTIGFVTDTEDNIRTLVDKLNLNNRSYYPKNEPENNWDENYLDADYISYTEFKVSTLEEIEVRYKSHCY